jgi:hypothetical protein
MGSPLGISSTVYTHGELDLRRVTASWSSLAEPRGKVQETSDRGPAAAGDRTDAGVAVVERVRRVHPRPV